MQLDMFVCKTVWNGFRMCMW